jgi:hypothetical protein
MNPIDIHRLQVLNDLVAQTIDIINQRNFAAGGFAQPFQGGYYGAGLSHTPFNPYVQQQQQPWAAQQQLGIVPQYPTTIPWGVPPQLAGLSHTPYVDPRWTFAHPSVFPMMPFVR